MGILSCFNGKAKTKDRDVHSAPPMLGGQTRPGALKSPPSPVRQAKDGAWMTAFCVTCMFAPPPYGMYIRAD